MLVSFITTVSGKVFGGCRNTISLYCFNVFSPKKPNKVGIRAECSSIGNWVTEIIIYVNNWGKGPVAAKLTGFLSAYVRQNFSIRNSSSCGYFKRRGI